MKKNPWPYAIIGYFVVFIAAMASWITFAVRNDMELVRADYYEHEIKYQTELEKMARTSSVRSQIAMKLQGSTLSLTLPTKEAKGEVHLYRPSDSKLDRRYPLELSDSPNQQIDLADLRPGLWKVRVSWISNGLDYYFDQPLVFTGE